MQVGVCTWTLGPLALPEIAVRLQQLGFDGVELYGDVENLRPVEVNQLLNHHGLKVFSLTPANVDLAHPDADIRSKALDYYFRLVDFAAELGDPLVSCHGDVGRIAPISSQQAEWGWLVEGVTQICDHAGSAGISLVFEVLNRYESHLVNTAAEAQKLIQQVGRSNIKVLLDTYHMNIEEADLPAAVRAVGPGLGLFHVADSNRRGLGHGHIPFEQVFAALSEVVYSGPIIVEATADGPNPFTPVKDANYLSRLEHYLMDSLTWLRRR